MGKSCAALIATLCLACNALAAEVQRDPPAPGQQIYDELETVLVIGEQPGPDLWKVSKDDHVMWILGAYSLLPKGVSWQAKRLRAAITESKEVLYPGAVLVRSRGNTLLPELIKSHRNPGNARLQDLMPADKHAKWLQLREKYSVLGSGGSGPAFAWDTKAKWVALTQAYTGGDGIEELRPTFAWEGLRRAALDRSGLSYYDIEAVVNAIAKEHGIPVRKLRTVRQRIAVDIPDEKPPSIDLIDFGDTECLASNLDLLEPVIEGLKVRANAWARGNLDVFHSADNTGRIRDCMRELVAAVGGAELPGSAGGKAAQQRNYREFQLGNRKAEQAWLTAARAALRKNRTTFAVLPINRLLAADGYLARLRELGYAVEDPL